MPDDSKEKTDDAIPGSDTESIEASPASGIENDPGPIEIDFMLRHEVPGNAYSEEDNDD